MHSISWWPTIIALIVATISDVRSARIPNWLVVPFLIAGMLVATVMNGWSGLAHSVMGVLLATLVLGLFYLLGGMGMGDVKLCAGIGAWLGPHQLMLALVFTGIAGGVMALIWAARGGFLNESLSSAGDLVFRLRKRGLRPHATLTLTNAGAHKMPYAPAIAIGTILSFFALS